MMCAYEGRVMRETEPFGREGERISIVSSYISVAFYL
jgi:hypothetical protein